MKGCKYWLERLVEADLERLVSSGTLHSRSEECLELRYLLARVNQHLGNLSEAQEGLRELQGLSTDYRDVAGRLESLSLRATQGEGSLLAGLSVAASAAGEPDQVKPPVLDQDGLQMATRLLCWLSKDCGSSVGG